MFVYWQVEYTTDRGEGFMTELLSSELPYWLDSHPGYAVQRIHTM